MKGLPRSLRKNKDFRTIQKQYEIIQNSKIDKMKNFFGGFTTENVRLYPSSSIITTISIENGAIIVNKSSATEAEEGFDIIVDLSNALYAENILLSFDYDVSQYVHSTGSLAFAISILTAGGSYKEYLGTLNLNSLGMKNTYTIDLTKFIRQYDLDSGFRIRMATRNAFTVRISNFIVGEHTIENPLYGKKLYGGGDSIAAGTSVVNYISYLDLISQKNNMVLTKASVSGSTIAVREGRTDSVLEKLREHPEAFDYLLLEGGINDMFNDVPLGELTSGYNANFDETTFIGAMEAICKELNTVHFGQKALFILIHTIRSQTEKQKTYFDAAISALEKWRIPYIDMRKETNLAAWTEQIGTEWFQESGGLHPLLKTYKKYYVAPIEAKMKSL